MENLKSISEAVDHTLVETNIRLNVKQLTTIYLSLGLALKRIPDYQNSAGLLGSPNSRGMSEREYERFAQDRDDLLAVTKTIFKAILEASVSVPSS